MNTSIQAEKSAPYFGARAAGVIFLMVLLSYITADVLLTSIVSHLREVDGNFSLRNSSESRIQAIKMAVSAALNPSILLVITIALLKKYFPQESIRGILGRFGFIGPSPKFMLASFVGGVAFVLFFSKVLMFFFPPGPYITPHPASAINYAPMWGKLLFVFSVITLVPVAEELLFRGVLYKGIACSWNKFVSAFLVSFGFILIHPDTIESGYWLTHMALYTFPLVLVLIREITGKIFGSIMMHSGFNFGVIFF